MNDDEKEFAQLINALESAQQKFADASARSQRESVYEKEEGKYHTPTSMGYYRRAQSEREAATKAMVEAMEETAQATHALDAWIPKPVHESLDVGIAITAPMADGWANVGKSESGKYYVLRAPTREALEQKNREYTLENPRSTQIG